MSKGSNSFKEIVFNFMEASGFDKEVTETLVIEFREYSLTLVVSIKDYIANNNFKDASILLHRLKGSAGNIRATEISSQALRAEEALKILDIELVENLLMDIKISLKSLTEE